MKTLHEWHESRCRHFENEIEFQFQLGMLRAALLQCQEIENSHEASDEWISFIIGDPVR
jgi:hypothetical protein